MTSLFGTGSIQASAFVTILRIKEQLIYHDIEATNNANCFRPSLKEMGHADSKLEVGA